MKLKAWIPAFAGMTILLITCALSRAAEPSFATDQDTWANWERRWNDAFRNIPSRTLPGRTMGIIVPSDTRDDMLPMSAFGYDVLSRGSFHTAVILIQAPPDFPTEGLTVPGLDVLDTSFGRFPVDTILRERFTQGAVAGGKAITVEPTLFANGIPKILLRQLAALKFVLKKDVATVQVLPILVKFSDINSGIKDYAPFLVDRIREYGVDSDVVFMILANLTRTNSEEKLIQTDAPYLKSIRELDADAMMAPKPADTTNDDFATLLLGLLTLRWMGADHADIFAYAHSGQMVLTKDKHSPVSYIAAGIASKPPLFPKVPHVEQEKMADLFSDMVRSDMLALTRQTMLSTLDPTAAKPPSMSNAQSGKKWPVYVTLFDSQGKLCGQAGSHEARAPLEESLRKYTFEAVRRAQPDLTKANAANYVIEISIPYGFSHMSRPDDYVPLLNGVVVEMKLKTQAMHPDTWRIYPDPHQMLSVISTRLGSDPWAYATDISKLDSFRVFSFNEKEPFQDLGGGKRKKKKSDGSDETPDTSGGGGDTGGGGSFGF